ncbi:MAG: DUF2064 domain-containing protein [Nitrosomonas sp.]|nr:DUF2064 domain-containing protein [Nitrosomonas sp.]
MEATLVLVCKRPQPGKGKQRLVAELGIEATQQIAQALLDCALEDALAWRGPVVIAPAADKDVTWAQGLLATRSRVCIYPQSAGNLGQRLNVLDNALRQSRMTPLIFIGSDAPLLNAADYADCMAALQDCQTVLKPAVDGGVVMMASHLPWPPLDDLPWSTERLGGALLDCCQRIGQTVCSLTEGSDVDQPQDVSGLCVQLRDDPRPARRRLYGLACTLITGVDPDVYR